jgi:hypothetical protein
VETRVVQDGPRSTKDSYNRRRGNLKLTISREMKKQYREFNLVPSIL